jgi:hypothetical protein
MQFNILPKTTLGKWSIVLATASPLCPALLGMVTGFDSLGAGLNIVFLNSLKIIFVSISLLAFVTGVIAITKLKDLSILIIAGIAIALWFIIPEIAWLFRFSEQA